MRQHNLNGLLCESHLASQISECPVCVREERDRYRKALEEIVDAVESIRPTSYTWAIATKALEGKA